MFLLLHFLYVILGSLDFMLTSRYLDLIALPSSRFFMRLLMENYFNMHDIIDCTSVSLTD